MKRCKKTAAAILALLSFAIIIFNKGLYPKAEETGPYLEKGEYWGYIKHGKGMYSYPVYIFDDGFERVAYCIDAKKAWPHPSENYPLYGWLTKYEKSSEIIESMDGVKKAIYNGYPYDNAGLSESLSLSGMELRAVTQAAVWRYTDGYSMNTSKNKLTRSTGFSWTDNMTKAYEALTSLKGSTIKAPDSDFKLELFTPVNDEAYMPVQRLISTGVNSGEVPPLAPVYDKPESPEETPQPENPEVPSSPETPEVPSQPEIPEVPSQPEIPEVPEEQESAEQPEIPQNPGALENPNGENKPESIEKPDSGIGTGETESSIPKTGDNDMPLWIVSASLSFIGMFILRKRAN